MEKMKKENGMKPQQKLGGFNFDIIKLFYYKKLIKINEVAIFHLKEQPCLPIQIFISNFQIHNPFYQDQSQIFYQYLSFGFFSYLYHPIQI